MPSTQPARGMRDFLPAEVRRRQYAIRIISEIYEKYGFEPLETPAVENLETLLGKYGEEGNQLIFRIQQRGAELVRSIDTWGDRASQRALEAARDTLAAAPTPAVSPAPADWSPNRITREGLKAAFREAFLQNDLSDLALRYDLTVPLARVVANYRGQLPKFFKRYQIQPVWRADRPARGRFREFYQCDVDVLGSTSPTVEAELCGAAAEALTKLGFADFTIRLNHRQLLTALLDVAGVASDKHGVALVALDKLGKVTPDKVLDEMQSGGISAAAAGEAMALFLEEMLVPMPTGEKASNAALLEALGGKVKGHSLGGPAVENLTTILRMSDSTSAAGRIRVDPSLARGLSYYTGAIMEITVPDLAGSLGGGGRYDNLVGMFLGQPVPACGFSLGLERIIVVMTERGMFPAAIEATHADVMVALWSADRAADSLALAGQLRAAGLRVDVYPDPDKLGKQFKYAGERRVPFVVVVGDEERASGDVSIKDLRSGQQTRVPRGDSARHIADGLSAKSG